LLSQSFTNTKLPGNVWNFVRWGFVVKNLICYWHSSISGLKETQSWEKLIADIRERYKKLPALQDELNQLKL